MKFYNIVFEDGGACGRYAEDEHILLAELSEEFPGRKIISIIEAYMEQNN